MKHTASIRHDRKTGQAIPQVDGIDQPHTFFDDGEALRCATKECERRERLESAAPELLAAAKRGLACCIAWGGKCEANGEHILAKESVIQAEIIRAAIARATGEVQS